MPYSSMKMTMHIDEKVLSEVMRLTGSTSKTGAVEKALAEMVRRSQLKSLLKEGLGMTASEIKASFDFETYDALDPKPPSEAKNVTYKKTSRPNKSSVK